MAKGKRAREEVDAYESDGGFVEEDDGPKSKKTKKAESSSKSKGDSENKFWEVNHLKSDTMIVHADTILSYPLAANPDV